MEKSKSNKYASGFVPFALGAFLVGIVGGFTTVLGPAFVKDLGLDYNNTAWTSLALAISSAACAPILGKLGDAIGKGRTLILGIGIFTLGNVLTATSATLISMLAARFVVGLGSAAIAPVVMSYIVTEFPKEKQGVGFSLYMLISSCAVIFGPTLGGIMINGFGWRAMVWVCVAICIIVFLACLALCTTKGEKRRSLSDFDYIGSFLVLLFFGSLLCIPSFGQNIGWSSAAFLLSVICALISLFGLCIAERRAKNPILRWDFIKRKRFVLSVLALFLTQGLMQANMTNTIVFVNYTQADNTVISGYAISVMYIGMSLGALLLGPLADRYEPKNVLLCSFAVTGLGCALMLAFSESVGTLLLALSLGILGFGLGGNGTVFMKVVLSGVPVEAVSSSTGTYGLFRDLAAPFGVAVFVPMFTNSVTSYINEGASAAYAAAVSIREIALIEIFCVILGICAVLFLPRTNSGK